MSQNNDEKKEERREIKMIENIKSRVMKAITERLVVILLWAITLISMITMI